MTVEIANVKAVATLDRESLPDGTVREDIIAAVQAAWLADDYALSRDLVRRYLDADGSSVCMRCATSLPPGQLWQVGNHLGIFFVCPDCSTAIVDGRREMFTLAGELELFTRGPVNLRPAGDLTARKFQKR